MKNRVLSIALVLLLATSMLPTAVFAMPSEEPTPDTVPSLAPQPDSQDPAGESEGGQPGEAPKPVNEDQPQKTRELEAPATYTVTIDSSENGTITADKTTAAEGDTVTLTFAPADGYELGLVSVRANGINVTTTAMANNQCTFEMPAGDVTVSATFSSKSTGPATGYDLLVGGEEVTSDKLSGTGWIFKPNTRTLTLTNATINGNIQSGRDLNIVFSGDITVNGWISASNFTDTHYALSISGTGSLTATTGNPNGAIMAGSITLGDGLQITVPEGGQVYTANGAAYIVNSGGVAATSVTLASSTPADTKAPTLTDGSVERTSDTEATVSFTSDEAGTYYYLVASENDSAPSNAGMLVLSAEAQGKTDSCVNGNNTIPLTGLDSDAKTVYLVAEDAAGNVSNMLAIDIPAYVPAPELTAGEVSRTSNSDATVKFTSSEAGTYSYTVVPSGSTDLFGTVKYGHCAADENTITLTGLNIGAQDIFIQVTNAAEKKSDWLTITIPAYQAPDTDDTCITIEGITENGEHPIGTGIGFTAIGKGMDNASPVEGDQQCRPFHWKVLDSSNAVVASGNWVEADTIPVKASYDASINTDAMAAGQYTLIVGCSLWEWQSGVWTPYEGFEVDEPMNTHSTVSIGFSVIAYSVTYTDGVDNEVIFPDQIYNNMSYGDPTPLYEGTFSRAGYTFAGWSPEVAATVTGNAVYAAQWTDDSTPTPTYTVTFNSNGGTGTMAAQTFTQGIAQSLTANSFTRSGYTFVDWNTEANGGGTAYSDGQSVTLTTGGLTLYAQWQKEIVSAKTEAQSFDADDITDELRDKGYTTPEQIEAVLKTQITQTGVPSGNTAFYDIVLLYSDDGGNTWTRADAEHFPTNGRLPISIPVPSGVDAGQYDFYGIHMFANTAFGKTAGETEEISFTERTEGGTAYLDGYVTGLSPILVGWKTSGGTDPNPTPTIAGVTVSPATATMNKGSTQQFTAAVSGTGSYNTAVTWSISGHTSSNTTINASGLLSIGADETATTITVKATAVSDTGKYGTAAVTVQTGGGAGGDTNDPSHSHSFGNWQYDSKNHWRYCSCGTYDSHGEHSFGGWKAIKEATTYTNGNKERSCSVCGYTEKVTIQAAVIPQTGDNSQTRLWTSLVGAALAGVLAVRLFGKRRTAQDEN